MHAPVSSYLQSSIEHDKRLFYFILVQKCVLVNEPKIEIVFCFFLIFFNIFSYLSERYLFINEEKSRLFSHLLWNNFNFNVSSSK